jgi:tetratricopeptide (TPR) repeat protein
MISKFLVAAVSAGFLFGAAQTAIAADAPKGPKLTSGVAKALTDAQKAGAAKDYPAASAAIEKARAVANPTPEDLLWINRIAISIHAGMNDMAAADVDAEAAADLDPSVIPPADKPVVYKTAMQLAGNAKHYDKAVKYAKLFQATNPPPSDLALIAQAFYLGGDYAGTIAVAQKNVDTATAAGQKPARMDLDLILGSQAKLKDEVGAEKTLETLVANYNMPDDWGQIMGVSLTTKGMRDIDYIYMGRLMFLQGGKIRPEDASLIGSTASRLGFLGEAVQAQKLGGSGFTDPGTKVDADKKSFPAQVAAGAKQNGVYNVKTAEAAYGYEMFADAENLAKAAKAKGSVPDATEPDMVLGMAQAAQGKYADAAQTFASVNQPNPASARVVRLWTYYVKTKANPAAN